MNETWRNVSQRWFALEPAQRRIAIAAASIAAIAIGAIAWLISIAMQPPWLLLYGGLETAAAGEALVALESEGVPTRVRGNAILVPADRRDAARLTLAQQGLPEQGQSGYELLDNLTGFSTTSEMFDAAYWRAREGELARTILAMAGVKSVRVHLAIPRTAPFARDRGRPSAAVSVTMSSRSMTADQANAIRHLVSLAVPELTPDRVAVIDRAMGLVTSAGPENEDATGATTTDAVLQSRLLELLEARVGSGNARVAVKVVFDQGEEKIVERSIDPEGRVLVDENVTQIEENAQGQPQAVTVASNLPEGTTEGAGTQSRRKENRGVNRYEVSEIRRERAQAAGGVQRITAAILLNHASQRLEDGSVAIEARSVEELEAVRRLVEAAIGFDAARGDSVVVETLAFDVSEAPATDVRENLFAEFLSREGVSLIQIAIPAIVAIFIGLFVLRPILRIAASPPIAAAPRDPISIAGGTQSLSAAQQLAIERLRAVGTEKPAAAAAVLQSWVAGAPVDQAR